MRGRRALTGKSYRYAHGSSGRGVLVVCTGQQWQRSASAVHPHSPQALDGQTSACRRRSRAHEVVRKRRRRGKELGYLALLSSPLRNDQIDRPSHDLVHEATVLHPCELRNRARGQDRMGISCWGRIWEGNGLVGVVRATTGQSTRIRGFGWEITGEVSWKRRTDANQGPGDGTERENDTGMAARIRNNAFSQASSSPHCCLVPWP